VAEMSAYPGGIAARLASLRDARRSVENDPSGGVVTLNHRLTRIIHECWNKRGLMCI